MVKILARLVLVCFLAVIPGAQAAEEMPCSKQTTSPYKDIYDQNIHGEIVNQLDLSRWGRKLFHKPLRSANANIFDEVADSSFFTNRHARAPLSAGQLEKGFSETDGLDASQDLTVIGGEIKGLQLSFLVKDSHGDNYFLKFDSAESPELATSAEVIANRFFYALGYNVPQYAVTLITADKLKVGDDIKFRDDSGFLKTLTQERLEEYMLFAPQTDDGSYRVSASKVIAGENKGPFSLTGRCKKDPEDLVNHRDRREIRALPIFSAWLNNTDISESNTLTIAVDENGNKISKHYLVDLGGALGSAFREAKPPMFGHEYLFDFGDTAKAFLTLGFWEKPWQERWRKAGEKSNSLPAAGYLDNNNLDVSKYKVQLPYEAFKRVTRADGFWAAKQMMAFRDEDIRALISAGKITSAESAEYIAKILIERRELLLKYWLEKSNALDDFKVEGGKLVFKDLAVQAGFEKLEARSYAVEVFDSRGKIVSKTTVAQPELMLDSGWFSENFPATIQIRINSSSQPFVQVRATSSEVLSIRHQD